mmetsp:Transcript_9694/g.37725  ORF Transcript_9694/g.37725 Transcript_9694/m.37725 type:complete len:270 (+) Transcript_9694:260-1069(+)
MRLRNVGSEVTTAAVRWWERRSRQSSTISTSSSSYSQTTWKGPNTSEVTSSKNLGSAAVLMGTETAVGSMAPYTGGMVWPVSSLPPQSSLAPGRAASLSAWASMRSVVQLSTGPTVRSARERRPARDLSWSRMSVFLLQFLWTKRMDWAEHFCPVAPYASWSHCQATYWMSRGLEGGSGPRIFQSKPASSSLTRPCSFSARRSATVEEPVKRVVAGLAARRMRSMAGPPQWMRSQSVAGRPHSSMSMRVNCSCTTDTRLSTLISGLFPM